MSQHVLVVDDEVNMRWVLKEALTDAGYEVLTASNGQDALAQLVQVPIDLIILDLKMKGMDGLGTLARIRERWPEVVVIILTAHGTVATAVEAMQLGAADYIRKPFDVEEVGFKIQRALERKALQSEVHRLRQVATRVATTTLVGSHPAWQRCVDQVLSATALDYDMALIGEAGTGKTTLARMAHAESRRGAAPRINVDLRMFAANHAADVLIGTDAHEGLWARAGDGTVILQHAQLLPAATCDILADLLRRRVRGPRLIVTSDREISPPLALARIDVPPLRSRVSDLPILAATLLPAAQWSDATLPCLERYPWPGNVAELKAVLERAAALAHGQVIEPSFLPAPFHTAHAAGTSIQIPPEGLNLEAVEIALIRQALELAHGNKTRAAELLGLTRHTLLYRLEKYGLEPER